ncbi:MAG: glycosyltransferase, partial [Muribaculaceae bacterium]|nr:glycosyltransferase [Muribaculaceae bacterium]
MNAPECSIIITVYNVERYLRECLDSVVAIEGIENCEIIIVNDGSTDSSPAIAQEYASKYKSIQVINQKNSGLADARNSGLEVAKGNYIYFIDSDDYVNKRFVADTLEILKQNPNTDLLQYRLEFVDESRNSLQKTVGPTTSELNIDLPTYGDLRYFQPYSWSWVYSKKFIDSNNLRFDASIRLAEDADFILRCFFMNPT